MRVMGLLVIAITLIAFGTAMLSNIGYSQEVYRDTGKQAYEFEGAYVKYYFEDYYLPNETVWGYGNTSLLYIGSAASIGICLVIWIIWLAVAYWAYGDAKRKCMDSPIVWALVVFFLGLIGLIIYFVVRKDKCQKNQPPSYVVPPPPPPPATPRETTGYRERARLTKTSLENDDKLQKLAELYEAGLLTREEYEEKKRVLERKRRGESELTEKFRSLKELRDEGILTEEEYQRKKEELLRRLLE